MDRSLPLYPDVAREFFYLGRIFGWEHFPQKAPARNHAVLLCPPLGHEYTHTHRTFKHLAEYLASFGFHVIRFDYDGTGNSAGTAIDSDRVQTWINNICGVAREIGREAPDMRLSCIGLRLGATLACLAANDVAFEHMVLWEPIVKGRGYVRELKALARLAGNQLDVGTAGFIESVGFMMSEETAQRISTLDLTGLTIMAKSSVLIVRRDDRENKESLAQTLRFAAAQVNEATLAGYARMLAEPHLTEVPFSALEHIADWLVKKIGPAQAAVPILGAEPRRVLAHKQTTIALPSEHASAGSVEESAHWCNSAADLFGVLSTTTRAKHSGLPALILLNAGSVHHIGPNRVYVTVARELAARGYPVLRIDLGGLGDSPSAVPTLDNHPYQPNAIPFTYAAIAYLRKLAIADRFILAGICSGAHTAFHGALAELKKETSARCIERVLLINPLAFYWKEGMALGSAADDSGTIRDKHQIGQSLRSASKWKKLLLGQVSYGYFFQFAKAFAGMKLRMWSRRARNLFTARKNPLEMDLNRLVQHRLPVEFIISSTDPGLALIKRDAQKSFTRGLTESLFHVSIVEGADHTFSQEAMRQNLLHVLTTIFSRVSTTGQKPAKP